MGVKFAIKGDNLQDGDIAKAVPAVFADKAYWRMSERYAFIPTSIVLSAMREAGWRVREAAQHGVRIADKAPFTRHMLRFYMPDALHIEDPRGKALFPEIVLVNGHDGSARYSLYLGLFSFICSNGLVVGNMYGGVSMVHSGMSTRDRVVAESRRILESDAGALMQNVKQMADKVITDAQRTSLAAHAIALRYRSVTAVLTPEQLLERHRQEDLKDDLWTALNVVQENVLSRQHEGQSAWGRRTSIRAVTQVKENIRINRGLWDKAVELLNEQS